MPRTSHSGGDFGSFCRNSTIVEELAATRLPAVLAALAYRDELDERLVHFLIVHSPAFRRHWAIQNRPFAHLDLATAKTLLADPLPTVRVLAVSASAQAHISAVSPTAVAGKTIVVELGVGHGCEGSDTYALTVDIPKGMTSVRPMGSDFGKTSLTYDAADPALVTSVGQQCSEDGVQDVAELLGADGALTGQPARQGGEAGDVDEGEGPLDRAVPVLGLPAEPLDGDSGHVRAQCIPAAPTHGPY